MVECMLFVPWFCFCSGICDVIFLLLCIFEGVYCNTYRLRSPRLPFGLRSRGELSLQWALEVRAVRRTPAPRSGSDGAPLLPGGLGFARSGRHFSAFRKRVLPSSDRQREAPGRPPLSSAAARRESGVPYAGTGGDPSWKGLRRAVRKRRVSSQGVSRKNEVNEPALLSAMQIAKPRCWDVFIDRHVCSWCKVWGCFWFLKLFVE